MDEERLEERARAFYAREVDTADCVRVLMYRQMAPYLLGLIDTKVVALIEHTHWDSNLLAAAKKSSSSSSSGSSGGQKQAVRGEYEEDDDREYVLVTKRAAVQLRNSLEWMRRQGTLPQRAWVLVWESVCMHAMDVLLEGYGRVRRCGSEGRTAMLIDLQRVADCLAATSGGLRPVPGSSAVEALVQARFMSSVDDVLVYGCAHPEATARMLVNAFQCGAAAKLARKQRAEAQQALEDLARARVRRPLWHFVTHAQLAEARHAQAAALAAARLQQQQQKQQQQGRST